MVVAESTRPIGMFDSGLGGLTVARAVIDFLPHEDLVYFGDTGRFPYGPRPPDEVRRFSLEIADLLVEEDVKLIVVACNSAESAAFYKRKAEDPACREQIATAIRAVTGSSLRLAYALADDAAHQQAAAEPTMSEDELIDAFMREFDAEELPAEEES